MVTAEVGADGLYRTRGAETELAFGMAGTGTPVVLLHGTSANFAVWEPVARSLQDRATVISLDQRGHGRSDKPAAGYDGAAFADDIIVVLDALGLHAATLVGHSLGARNAWVAAARYPDRVSAVVAVDYVPYVSTPVLDALQSRVAGGDQVFSDEPQIRDYLRHRYPRMPEDAIQRRTRWGYTQRADGQWVPLAPAGAMDQLVDGLRAPWDEEFAAVRVPMTCVRGRDSAIVSEQAWAASQPLQPRARWTVVDGVDHYIPEERPAVVAMETASLLEIVESR